MSAPQSKMRTNRFETSFPVMLNCFNGFSDPVHQAAVQECNVKTYHDPAFTQWLFTDPTFKACYAALYAQALGREIEALTGIDLQEVRSIEPMQCRLEGEDKEKIVVHLAAKTIAEIQGWMRENPAIFYNAYRGVIERYREEWGQPAKWIPGYPYEPRDYQSPTYRWTAYQRGTLLEGLSGGGWDDAKLLESDRFRVGIANLVEGIATQTLYVRGS